MGVTSLSSLGGNFVLAKVRWGLISVRCLELKGEVSASRRFEGGQASCPLCRGCPLFGESVIRVLLYLHREEFYHE